MSKKSRRQSSIGYSRTTYCSERKTIGPTEGIVGSLLWAASMKHPDISSNIALIAGAMNAPKIADMKRAAMVIEWAKRSKVVL